MPPEQRDTLIAAIVNDVPEGERQYLKTLMKFATTQDAHAEQDYQDSRQVRAAVEASEAKRRSDDQTRSEHLQDFGFILIGLGVVYIIVGRFIGLPVGWGLVPIGVGAAYVGVGLIYGELVTWLGYHGQKLVTGIVWTAIAGILAIVYFILKREYKEAPVGWHGMFWKIFWPDNLTKTQQEILKAV